MTSRLPGIAVVGELNVDLVATGIEKTPSFGHEVLAQGFDVVLGSASAVFACGVRKLGHPVTFVGKVGDDLFGRFCLGELRREGIRTTRVLRDRRSATGVTISLSSAQDRMLVTYAGAIATLRYSEIPIHALKGRAHLHTTSFFLQEALRSAVPRLHEAAHRLGLTTSFDPNTDPADDWGDDVWSVIERADVTFMNAQEARRLTRQKDLRRALGRLAEASRCVVIKLGPAGAIGLRGNELAYSPGFVVPCVDTTGAGDSFDAGFVSAFVEARELGACLDRGNVAGALSATGTGGTARQPAPSTVERFLKANARRRTAVPDAWLQAARIDLG